MKISAPLILENKFKHREVTAFFNQIGVSQEEMLVHIQEQLEKDPNREQIETKINMFRKKGRTKQVKAVPQ